MNNLDKLNHLLEGEGYFIKDNMVGIKTLYHNDETGLFFAKINNNQNEEKINIEQMKNGRFFNRLSLEDAIKCIEDVRFANRLDYYEHFLQKENIPYSLECIEVDSKNNIEDYFIKIHKGEEELVIKIANPFVKDGKYYRGADLFKYKPELKRNVYGESHIYNEYNFETVINNFINKNPEITKGFNEYALNKYGRDADNKFLGFIMEAFENNFKEHENKILDISKNEKGNINPAIKSYVNWMDTKTNDHKY